MKRNLRWICPLKSWLLPPFWSILLYTVSLNVNNDPLFFYGCCHISHERLVWVELNGNKPCWRCVSDRVTYLLEAEKGWIKHQYCGPEGLEAGPQPLVCTHAVWRCRSAGSVPGPEHRGAAAAGVSGCTGKLAGVGSAPEDWTSMSWSHSRSAAAHLPASPGAKPGRSDALCWFYPSTLNTWTAVQWDLNLHTFHFFPSQSLTAESNHRSSIKHLLHKRRPSGQAKYIYAFSRRFYPKWLTVHSGYTLFISTCVVPWESNP